MNYVICKILTSKFYDKFIKEVEEEVEVKVQRKIKEEFPDGVPDTVEAKKTIKHLKITKDFDRIMIKDSYYFMWGHKDEFKPDTTEILKHSPLWEPEFFEEIFEDVTSGLQNHTRIVWKGKITKVDFIDEIIASREPKDDAEREWFLAKKIETEQIHRQTTDTPA